MPTIRHAALVAAVVLLATSCSPGQQGTAKEDHLSGEQAAFVHAQCMRDHGFDWSDPTLVDGEWRSDPDEDIDLDSPEYVEAEADCQRGLDEADPAGGADPEARAQLEEEMERMLAFAACMRDEGLEFPDPVMEGGAISGPAGPMDGDWDAFNAARETCEERTGAEMD